MRSLHKKLYHVARAMQAVAGSLNSLEVMAILFAVNFTSPFLQERTNDPVSFQIHEVRSLG